MGDNVVCVVYVRARVRCCYACARLNRLCGVCIQQRIGEQDTARCGCVLFEVVRSVFLMRVNRTGFSQISSGSLLHGFF